MKGLSMTIQVKADNSTYTMVDWTLVCDHTDSYIEKACCTAPDPDTGRYSCTCYGLDTTYCNNDDCTEVL